jgi:hypothetical protein
VGCLPNKDRYIQDFYCLTSGSKYKNLVYFITYVKFVYEYAVHLLFCANSKYANEFQLNMPHDYIGTYLLWRLLWWTRTTPPYLLCWVPHGHGGSNTSLHWISTHSHLIWWLKSWISLRQNSKSYCWFGYFILTWNTKNTEWLTYRHLLTGQHSTPKAKTLTRAMCTKEWLQEGLIRQSWVFIGCRYSFLKFWIYLAFSVFINCLYLFTTFL